MIRTHNSKAPWPVSYDGRKAQRCDKNARHNSRGRYIVWQTQDALGVHEVVAKLVNPKTKIQPVDIDEVKKALTTDPKYNVALPKARIKTRNRLNRVYGNMGINYIDSMNITHITPEVETACWGTGEKENDEFILCNPYFFMQRQRWAQFLLQHEIMHRALYRGRKHLVNHQLRNIVFDICINRILAAGTNGKPNKSWQEFCQWIYPDESKKTVLALCNASLTQADLDYLRNEVNPIYAQIWESLYGTQSGVINTTHPRSGKMYQKRVEGLYVASIASMNPDDLYFKLRHELTDKDKEALNGFGQDGGFNPFGDGDKEVTLKGRRTVILRKDANNIAGEAAVRVETAVRKSLIPKRFRTINYKSFSNTQTNWWDAWVITPEKIRDPELEKYAQRIRTRKIMDNVTGRITESFEEEVKILPYPENLTEEGMMLSLLGMRPPKWPFFKNQHGLRGKRRVVVFFDTSPSMEFFFPYVCYMCDSFEENMEIVFAANDNGDPGVMTFAGSVKTLDRDEIRKMREGKFPAGISTSFDAVVEYCNDQISTSDVDACIIFTDGESSVTEDNVQKFNATGKLMYRIYFQDFDPRYEPREIQSDLDRLNGESFQLCLPKTDIVVGQKI